MADDGIHCPTCHQPHNSYPELIEARTLLKDKEKETQSIIAQLRKEIEEAPAKAQELQEANTQDWIEHLKGGGCADGNCIRGRLVKEVFEKGKVEGKSGIDIHDVAAWLRERKAFGVMKDSKDGKNKVFTRMKI